MPSFRTSVVVRTSTPIFIPTEKNNFMHLQLSVKSFFERRTEVRDIFKSENTIEFVSFSIVLRRVSSMSQNELNWKRAQTGNQTVLIMARERQILDTAHSWLDFLTLLTTLQNG